MPAIGGRGSASSCRLGHVLDRRHIGRAVSQRQVTRAVRFAGPVLEKELGPDGAERVLGAMRREYVALAPSLPRLRAPMSRMTLRLAVDALALQRAVASQASSGRRARILSGFVSAWMQGQFETCPARWVYAHRRPHLLLRRCWFISANLVNEPAGWRFRFVPGRPGLFYGVDVTRCGIATFLAAQGAADLGPLLCRGDHEITCYLPPGVRFERTQVIAEGAPYCDFRYLDSPHGSSTPGPTKR